MIGNRRGCHPEPERTFILFAAPDVMLQVADTYRNRYVCMKDTEGVLWLRKTEHQYFLQAEGWSVRIPKWMYKKLKKGGYIRLRRIKSSGKFWISVKNRKLQLEWEEQPPEELFNRLWHIGRFLRATKVRFHVPHVFGTLADSVIEVDCITIAPGLTIFRIEFEHPSRKAVAEFFLPEWAKKCRYFEVTRHPLFRSTRRILQTKPAKLKRELKKLYILSKAA